MAESDGHESDGDRPWERNPLGHNPLLDDEAVLAELFGVRDPTGAAGSQIPPMGAPLSRQLVQSPQPQLPPSPSHPATGRRRRRAASRPTHYRVVSFSLYQEDIDRLEQLVRSLKARGHTKANKSQVVRFALATVDIDAMPKPV